MGDGSEKKAEGANGQQVAKLQALMPRVHAAVKGYKRTGTKPNYKDFSEIITRCKFNVDECRVMFADDWKSFYAALYPR